MLGQAGLSREHGVDVHQRTKAKQRQRQRQEQKATIQETSCRAEEPYQLSSVRCAWTLGRRRHLSQPAHACLTVGGETAATTAKTTTCPSQPLPTPQCAGGCEEHSPPQGKETPATCGAARSMQLANNQMMESRAGTVILKVYLQGNTMSAVIVIPQRPATKDDEMFPAEVSTTTEMSTVGVSPDTLL